MQQKPIIVQFIWTYFRLFKCKAVLTTNYSEYCVSCTVCCSTKWCNLNERTLASFSFILGLFKQTIIFLQQINVKKSCQSSIWRWDSNPRPLELESSPISAVAIFLKICPFPASLQFILSFLPIISSYL